MILTKLDRLKGYSAREACVALLSMLAILLFASAIAVAQTPIVISQQFWGANETNSAVPFAGTTTATSGGNWGPASAGGHSAALNSDGVFVVGTSYGGYAEQFTSQASAMTVIGYSNQFGPGGMAIDGSNNLYISGEYSNIIYKVPMNATANGVYGVGTYGPVASACLPNGTCAFGTLVTGATGATITPPTTCLGTSADAAAGICQINLGSTFYNFDIASMVFDRNGNLFFTTDNESPTSSPASTYGAAPYSVFECTASCLYGPSATGTNQTAPVLIFAEPTNNSAGQLYTGAIAVDQNENVYFTDSFISNTGATDGYSTYSDLYQVPYNSSSGKWATTPTLLWTLTPACVTNSTPCNDAITTVVTDATGNIYFGTALDGVFKIAHSSSLGTNPTVIPISGEGVKTLVPDGKGNFYFVNTNPTTNDDTAGFLAIGAVDVTAQSYYVSGGAGAGSVSNVSAVDDTASACPALTALTFTEAASYNFSGAASSCNSLPFDSGINFPTTITLSPATTTKQAAGLYTTTMTAENTADGDSGTFSVSGVDAAAQAITVTSPSGGRETVTYSNDPINLIATASSGLPVTFTSTTTTVCTVKGNTVTLIGQSGTGTCTIHANQPGNIDWAPAPQVTITITVTLASVTLTSCMPSSIVFTPTPMPVCVSSNSICPNPAPICLTFQSGPGSVSGTCEPGQMLTLTGTTTPSNLIDITATTQSALNGCKPAGTITINIAVTSAPQTIVFMNPAGTLATAPAPITYGSAMTLAAAGGGSGNPVTFSLDPLTTCYVPGTPASGTTPAVPASSCVATLSGTNDDVLTVTGMGTIVIDANQAASAIAAGSAAGTSPKYAAANPVQAFLVVTPLGAAPAPVISPANGSTLYLSGGANTITLTDAISGTSIYYTTDGSIPVVNVVNGVLTVPTGNSATLYTGPFTLTNTGPATVNAVAIGGGYAISGVSTANYNVSTTAANFTTTVAPSSVTVTPSQPAIVGITLTSQYGFNSATTFTCSTVPSNLTCSFNPATVTPATGQSASTALTISESSSSAALQRRSNPFLPGGAAFAIAVCFLGWKKRRALLLALVLIAGVIGAAQLSGCGGSGSKASTTSNVVVTATSGKLTQTVQISVTVTQ